MSPTKEVELVRSDAIEFDRSLKNQPGSAIWLCGGAKLATSLLGARLIDGVVLQLHARLCGHGTPLFVSPAPFAALELTEHKVFETGVIRLHYRVLYSGA